jgi:hypothetical protein
MDNRALAAELCRKGRIRAEIHFDASKNALKIYEVYKKVLNGR